MKLNPTKCTFGVALGKFLGFMVYQSKMEANPDNIQAIIDMYVSTNLKQFQGLNGKGSNTKQVC